ncbi:site-specific integrase [Pseudomonas juntendi]|uniref:site-specific integrase n=3 Tax=Pseudomonas TaxID=286 RepID=UPI000DAF8E6C|nr:site-specific integrase [Pseudomonas juntendi]MDH0045080.1 site-specific integrase [Pseudomonas juntendi]PZR87403.1 MAG: integrase [Stutzerimonas stutzeri]
MGRERITSGLEAEVAKHTGIEIHGGNLRIVFMWRRIRCRESLGLPVTKANIKHAALLRAAILHEIKIGTFEYGRHFPNSKHAANYSNAKDERLAALAERYKPLKAIDITPMTEEKYSYAIDICVDLVGGDRLAGILLPEDIHVLRARLIETRAPSTANHYLATFAGFLTWCESNNYCITGLAAACTRFAMSDKEPDPLTHNEFELLISKGCLHPQDAAAITLAVYTGLRPGELCALAVEDIDLEAGKIEITRAITANGSFKTPKTGKPRTLLLMEPALKACRTLLEIVATHPKRLIRVYQNRHEWREVSVTPLLSPSTQARKRGINEWFVSTAWNTKWATIQRRAGIRARRPYQTRHTYACWCLTAGGNLAFIAKQMGHKDFTMLVEVYAKWIDSESPWELEKIWSKLKSASSSYGGK